METVKVGKKKQPRVFIARAWNNTSKAGLEYLNISFDRGLEITIKDTRDDKEIEYILDENATIQGFANKKRDGKQDADIRLSFALPTEEKEE